MERVKKGEIYYYVGNSLSITPCVDTGDIPDDCRFDCGNYFHPKEQAEAMARKLRAVINGAEAIEMPSEEEIQNKASEMCCIWGCDRSCEDKHFCGLAFPRERSIKMAEWIKSKIVK